MTSSPTRAVFSLRLRRVLVIPAAGMLAAALLAMASPAQAQVKPGPGAGSQAVPEASSYDGSALYPGPLAAAVPDNDNGLHIALSWHPPGYSGDRSLVFRAPGMADAPPLAGVTGVTGLNGLNDLVGRPMPAVGDRAGAWTLVAVTEDATFIDEVEPDGEPDGLYVYAVVTARPSAMNPDLVGALSQPALSPAIAPAAAFFNIERWFFLLLVLLIAAALGMYITRVRARPESVYVRRIPGVDAIEEAVGRSTEMGRPVLYVTGTEEIQNIQTIASLLVLGKVAEMTAEYDTEVKVANFFPLTMVVAEEIVKQGFAKAGRIDAHKPENVMFVSAEQFAFAAGVNGLIMRDRPATNIYMGRFFAESLMLAETGYMTRAIQIAGTAEFTQLPFFVAACDYTIIGEELYAVSAYLSREPVLLATLKATDLIKLIIIAIVVTGTIAATAGWLDPGPLLVP